ncbi:hypothetical protein DL93DRAFT_2234762 [Clavulina sp. PMI_390]|nr:hypothetical protein DL93DRAFT_2234762 [Clavulina sp. PMI_390]
MGVAHMAEFMRSLDRLAVACKVAHAAHYRGDFAHMIIGKSHGMGEGKNFPYRLAVHRKHEKPIQEFLDSAPVKLALKVGNEFFATYFPKVAAFCLELDAFWKEKTNGEAAMDFGHFYTMAINFPMVTEVKAVPHVDRMNLGFGPCAIMPFVLEHGS